VKLSAEQPARALEDGFEVENRFNAVTETPIKRRELLLTPNDQ
jgi:hypothetical protein